MSEDNVVQAFPGTVENPLKIDKPRSGLPLYCRHDAVRLNRHDRTIHCAGCGAALDPFDFLLTSAHTIEQAWRSHASAKTLIAELNDSVDFLKKEEKRLRGMVKRLQTKVDDVVVVRGKIL